MSNKEKLDRMKKLADAMYIAAQYLSTDASVLRKAMEEYHQFTITEYNKQEPASEDLEQAAEQAEQREGNLINGRFKAGFKSGAQWQKEQMMKDAVKGQVERGYCEDGISEHFEVFACLSGRDERFKDLSDGQSVKLIIIKE